MSDIVNKNENLELELDDNSILSNLFGVDDRNLSLIEKINQVKIQYRGNKIKYSIIFIYFNYFNFSII